VIDSIDQPASGTVRIPEAAPEGAAIRQTELAARLGLKASQVRHYFNRVRPELHPVKGAPLSPAAVCALQADFLPVRAGWQSSRDVARDLQISCSTVCNYCVRGQIEHRRFLHTYWVSPAGVATLKNLLHVADPDVRTWKSTTELAAELGVSRSAITLHCQRLEAGARKYKRGWRIPLEGVNALRNMIRKRTAAVDVCGRTYYPLALVAEQAARRRRLRGAAGAGRLMARYYHLRSAFPDHVPSLRHKRIYYVGEETRTILMDLLKQVEACRLLRVSRSALAAFMRQGRVAGIRIGPTTWTTYSSVMKMRQGGLAVDAHRRVWGSPA